MREEEWKSEVKFLEAENKILRKVVKVMLRPIHRNETVNDETAEHLELVSLEDDFSSIDERFDKVYSRSEIRFEDPSDDMNTTTLVKGVNTTTTTTLTSPYDHPPVQIRSINQSIKIASYKPFKRDPIKNPNFLEQKEIRKQLKIKEKNQKILVNFFLMCTFLMLMFLIICS